MVGAGRRQMKHMKKKIWTTLFSLLCVGILLTLPEKLLKKSTRPSIIVGAKNCTENRILGEILSIMIESHTSLSVKRHFHLDGTFICFQALRSGDIDLYAEYTGTALVSILKEEASNDSLESLRRVRQAFAESYQMDWLEPFGFSNTYAFFVRKEFAKAFSVKTLSDLAKCLKRNPSLKIGIDPEFMMRREFVDLQKIYECSFQAPVLMDPALIYLSLSKNQIDVGDGYSTDGLIATYDLCLLEDDRKALPIYDAAPLIRQSILEEFPFLKEILNRLASRITPTDMRRLNEDADKKGKNPYIIAKEFLIHQDLIPS